MSVTIRGQAELTAAFKHLDYAIKFKIGNHATLSGASAVRASIQRQVPVSRQGSKIGGVNITPGNLRRNIVVRRVKDTDSDLFSQYDIAVRAPRRLNAKQKATGRVGAYYWRYVEFGTSKMGARPFMRKGAAAARAEAVERIKAVLLAGIQTEVGQTDSA